jgi:outer membrane protein insertion porin family
VFADVQAAPRFSEEPGVIDLVYKVKEGEPFRVGMINVQIEGENPHTRNSTVLNRVSLRPGDLVDIRELRASESRIKASSLFELDRSKANPPQIVVVPPDAERGAASLAERPKPRAGSSIRR